MKRKRHRGGSIASTVNDFLKKHKVISRLGQTIDSFTRPQNALDSKNASYVTNLARRFGYGRGMMPNQGVYNAGGGRMRM
jgi:hypothetical protein